MKHHTCAQCGGRLGLGVRFKNYWSESWRWEHKRFCSSACSNLYDQAGQLAKQQRTWVAFLQSDQPVSQSQYMRDRFDR